MLHFLKLYDKTYVCPTWAHVWPTWTHVWPTWVCFFTSIGLVKTNVCGKNRKLSFTLKVDWNFRAMIRLCYQHLKWNQCRAHQVCIYKYAWNQIIPTWIEFIESWNEFIPYISNSLSGFNKNKSRAALGASIRKILFGTSSIYYFWFLEKFLIFNSAKLQFIQEWIHSRMESIHTN